MEEREEVVVERDEEVERVWKSGATMAVEALIV